MSDQLEDLYLKGMMAFNAKDYKAARAFWEQVVVADPNHAKARQGLQKLSSSATQTRKRSSKEVFQEIKKLYAAKNFPEALRLTNLLLKKHPENTDLQGLRKKLEARVGGGATGSAQPMVDKRSTMVMASDAELSVGDDGEDVGAKVEKLIQEGVSLYEIQDYEMAIETWKKAVALDPSNRIAQDYINNVSSLIASDQEAEQEPPPAPGPDRASAAAPPADNKPGKEQMLALYNDAMGLFKNRRYQEALDKWQYILQFYPNHAETLQCVEKTHAQMSRDQAFSDKLSAIRSDIAAGRLTEAESALTRLSIEAPHLSGLDSVQDELDAARATSSATADSVQSLGVDDDPFSSDDSGTEDREDYSASDDEITSYFGESTEQKGPRQVASAAPKKKKKKPINVFKVFAGVIVLAAMGVGGYYGYEMWRKQLDKSEMPAPIAVTKSDWNSAQQRVEDFFNFGSDFEDEGQWLLAAYAYQRVESIGTNRLEELDKEEREQGQTLARSQEIDMVSEKVNKSKVQAREMTRKIRGEVVDPKALELAKAEMRREEYAEARQRLMSALSADPKNDRARELLGQANQRLAFSKLKDGDLSGAMGHFKAATVLMPSYDIDRRHLEVIQRYFNGTIKREEKDQWFFFFE